MKSFFIVVDGMDGTGKTEIVKRLHNYLFSSAKNREVLATREPSTGKYGMEIRKYLADETDPMDNKDKLFELFVKDREDHLNNVINPFLENEERQSIIVCDRYYHSTLAFQQTQGIAFEAIREKNEKFRKPDLTLLLDLKPDIALERIKGRAKEKFEDKEFMEKLRNNFLSLKRQLQEKIIFIDANEPIEEVFKSIKEEVDALIGVSPA